VTPECRWEVTEDTSRYAITAPLSICGRWCHWIFRWHVYDLVAAPGMSGRQFAWCEPAFRGHRLTELQSGGAGSYIAQLVTSTAPGEPLDVSASPGRGSAIVSWVAPPDNGGSAIDSYTVLQATSQVGPFVRSATSPRTCTFCRPAWPQVCPEERLTTSRPRP
jgi:hypothetical protein